MDGCIAPSFIEKASGTIKVLKIVLVCLAPPKVHISNLKVAPEVACRKALSLLIVLGSSDIVNNPFDSATLV